MKLIAKQSLTVLIGGLFTILMAAPLNTAQASTCQLACSTYRTCVVDFWEKRGKTPTKEQREKLYGGCMKTCGQHKAKVLACYNSSKNSCPAYWSCIKKHYKEK